MPVFTEFSTSSRDLRVLPSFAPPVPRYNPTFEPKAGEEKYEVVIAGVRVSLPSSDSMLMLS
jgi:phenol 2-monooxygenase